MNTRHGMRWLRLGAAALAASTLVACTGGRDADSSAARELAAADQRLDLTGCAAAALSTGQLREAADAATVGAFSEPFCEEKFLSDYPDADVPDRGAGTNGLTNPFQQPFENLEHCLRRSEEKIYECKPSAGSIALLPDDRMVYFNALEGLENGEFNIFKEGGEITVNDQTRVVGINADGVANWTRPSPNGAGGVNPVIQPGGGTTVPVLGNLNPGQSPDDPVDNDGALFCAHLVNLYDGRVLAAGGTDYYTEFGLVELEGLKNTRIFDPASDTWVQADPMSWGRWYPTMTTLVNGNVFVASGVRKLIKPLYLDRPQDSGRNETHTEIFQPGCNNGAGKWTDNGEAGRKSLPLFPRLHLLPNNQVLYAAAGQAYNPFGEAYDEALWYFMSAYDPEANQWTDLGIPGTPITGGPPLPIPDLPGVPVPEIPSIPGIPGDDLVLPPGTIPHIADLPAIPDVPGLDIPGPFDGLAPVTNNLPLNFGFIGSTSNIMLPLIPDENGDYGQAEFLSMGGVILPTPGSYFPIPHSRIDTVDLSGGDMQLSSRNVGALNRARWYGQAVLLPSGEVMLFSGASGDEVVQPGTGGSITATEMFDPSTETWSVMATQGKERTYHNTAFLLPDGRVMVGGHSPISAGYALNLDLPNRSPQGRDPTFEIYSPPYVFRERPSISGLSSNAIGPGETLTIQTPQAADIAVDGEVVLIRRTAITHLVDGDQRSVVLPIVDSSGGSLRVRIPNNDPAQNQAVLPPGHYMLFVVSKNGFERTPSVSKPLQITGADLSCR